MTREPHILIVGGGIVGLATAYALAQRHARVTVLEKEPGTAYHQSGRNSGVIHSGVYYKPGSLKARLCAAGKQQMEDFCAREGIAYETCGKVIVATRESELSMLERIAERGAQNGVECRRISSEELHEREPHVAGIAALFVPGAGIVHYPDVCRRLAEILNAGTGRVVFNAGVTNVRTTTTGVVAETTAGSFGGDLLINCAGLHSDRVARLAGAEPKIRIVPFRGEYYELTPNAEGLVNHLIYPVPDTSFPFLGVHFTRMAHGGVECGPNAVLALAREGYSWRDADAGDLASALTWPGLWALARKHWRVEIGEVHRSLSKAAFVRALQRLVPEITSEKLVRGRAGVRAQAIARDGSLVDDFEIVRHERAIHVLNAPSPGATASLAIGEYVAGLVDE